jgi:hypothetical protein
MASDFPRSVAAEDFYPVNDFLRDWKTWIFSDSEHQCLIFNHTVVNQASVPSGLVFHVVVHRNWGRGERGFVRRPSASQRPRRASRGAMRDSAIEPGRPNHGWYDRRQQACRLVMRCRALSPDKNRMDPRSGAGRGWLVVVASCRRTPSSPRLVLWTPCGQSGLRGACAAFRA